MTITLSQVRADLAAAVTSTGLRCSPYIVDIVNAPCAMVSRGQFNPQMILSGGKTTYPFTVHVYTQRAAEKASQAALDLCADVTGVASLVTAIQNGSLWTTATVDYAQVTGVGGEQIADINGIQYITIQVDVEVVF